MLPILLAIAQCPVRGMDNTIRGTPSEVIVKKPTPLTVGIIELIMDIAVTLAIPSRIIQHTTTISGAPT